MMDNVVDNVIDNVMDNISTEYHDNVDSDGQEVLNGTSPTFFHFTVYLTTYIQPILFCFGLVGNFLSFIIFLSKSMRKISSNIYLAALSGSSYGFNLVLLLQWLEMVHVPIMHMQGVCQTIVYCSYVFSFLSVWLIVCISVENYIVTFHLSKAIIYCTVLRAKLVIGSLVTYAVLLYSGQFWTTSVVEFGGNYSFCTEVPEYSALNKIYSFWDTLTTLVLPIIITTVLIIAILTNNLCIVGRKSATDSCSVNRRLSKKQKSLIRITRVLLAIALTFVILSGPSLANKLRVLIQNETTGLQYYTLSDRLLQHVFQIFYYLSFCLNFFYYLIWSHNYRMEFKRLTCWTRYRRPRFRDIEMRLRGDTCNGHTAQTLMDKSPNNQERVTML